MVLIDETETTAIQEGVLGTVQPSRGQSCDVEFGWPLLSEIVDLDIGGAIAVRERDVIAVEATEGTASLIERAGALCRARGWTLLKTALAGEGREPGAPTITPETIRALAAAGGRCLAVGAGHVVFTEEARVIEAADRAGIAVIGVGTGKTPAKRQD
jgi:DUF1009 family protein